MLRDHFEKKLPVTLPYMKVVLEIEKNKSCLCSVFIIIGLFNETWRFCVAQGIKLQVRGALLCSVSCWIRFCEMCIAFRVV